MDKRRNVEIEKDIKQRISPLRAQLCPEAIEILAKSCDTPIHLYTASMDFCRSGLDRIAVITRRSQALVKDYAASASDERRRAVLQAHLSETIPVAKTRKADERALKRWMDLEALLDREAERIHDSVQEVLVALETLQSIAASTPKDQAQVRLSGPLRDLLLEVADPEQRDLLREQAIRALGAWVHTAGGAGFSGSKEFADLVEPWALDRSIPRWIQIASLNTLAASDPRRALTLCRARLRERTEGDDFIFRRNAVRIIAELHDKGATLDDLLIARSDPSEHVRQELVRSLRKWRTVPTLNALLQVLQDDASHRVRGLSVQELFEWVRDDRVAASVASPTLANVFRNEKASLVLRIALHFIPPLMAGEDAVLMGAMLVDPIAQLCSNATEPLVAEYAAFALRAIHVLEQNETYHTAVEAKEMLSEMKEGSSLLATTTLPQPALIEALRHAARGDLSVFAEPTREGHYRITRGEPRRRRLWRILHEIRNPMPDKRKDYIHTRARTVPGRIVVPPIQMAELTPTKVPGERRHVPEVGGWGPFLPRVDDFLAACERAVPIQVVSSAGVVSIEAPKGRWHRWRVWWRLSNEYARYCEMRESSIASRELRDRKNYIETMQQLGFRITLDPEPGVALGVPYRIHLPFVQNLFAQLGAWIPPFLEQPLSYGVSDEGNAPAHLALVALAIFSWVVLRATWVQEQIEKARAKIPLTIGGWGTRGKSGSERLKAGLFHGLGFNVVVKTTGCEAMLIHGVPGRPATEIFIYRPYDKATIWEQRDLLLLGARFRVQVFLWECMALRPAFVRLLNREWMQDRITTLTNAYPDHEDVMGPSGEEVARVIGTFSAFHGKTLTSEEEMLPILRDQVRAQHADFEVVTPFEADLLPEDLLSRFPYQEHPRNIALVTRLAETLGLERERSIVEMADHVVADIGVLKTYPEVVHRGRALRFSNGMSANERAGCLSCWTRLAFDKHDPDRNAEETLVTVVNNRADRVPRSRVFARILVQDLAAHRHILIGTNLGGLSQFIQEELDAWLSRSWIADEQSNDISKDRSDQVVADIVLNRFDDAMRRLKIPTGGPTAVRATVERMLSALSISPDEIREILAQLEFSLEQMNGDTIADTLNRLLSVPKEGIDPEDLRPDVVESARRFCTRARASWDTRSEITRASNAQSANEAFRTLYRKLFLDNVYVQWDSLSTGDQVVDAIARSVPPGHRVRVMGVQNIKGTGLDFVYRWQSLDMVHAALHKLERQPKAAAEILAWLASYAGYGILDCRVALHALKQLQSKNDPTYAEHESALSATIEQLSNLEKVLQKKLAASRKPGAFERFIADLEKWLDSLDAVYRRTMARRVLNDLTARRVGHARAAELMRDLTKRDKGGWLAKMVSGWFARKTT